MCFIKHSKSDGFNFEIGRNLPKTLIFTEMILPGRIARNTPIDNMYNIFSRLRR